MLDDSFLMCDCTEGDGKAEIVMDYILSWSLRHATSACQKDTPDLYRYCRYMLYKLLQLKSPLKQIVFNEVKVWKEWQHIDLCAEVTLTNDGKEEYYALLIENKYYSQLRCKRDNNGIWRTQVDIYKEIFEKHYQSLPEKGKWQLKYALVSCYEKDDRKLKMYKEAQKYGFKIFGFYDIIDYYFWNKDTEKYKDSESEIFNEFWLRKW